MTALRQFGRIAVAMLAMTGRVTMLGLARWAGPGGSYRTIQRFFHTTLPWAAILWAFVRTHLLSRDDPYLLVGNVCVVTKAGTETYGVDRFFSGIFGKPVPGARSSRWRWSVVPNGRRSRCKGSRCCATPPTHHRQPCQWKSATRGAQRAAAPRPRPLRP